MGGVRIGVEEREGKVEKTGGRGVGGRRREQPKRGRVKRGSEPTASCPPLLQNLLSLMFANSLTAR